MLFQGVGYNPTGCVATAPEMSSVNVIGNLSGYKVFKLRDMQARRPS